eukprot:TRINITY_DN10336_c0_g1_i2.p1 TRINITY_DN10336_c0_g1~~TRINITY_DN10336_c0_g1_i2.p1  ORF type:complete len:307 (-),score=41.29 TRINITY_DN10336_c0_g1_i2:95-1015(-)
MQQLNNVLSPVAPLGMVIRRSLEDRYEYFRINGRGLLGRGAYGEVKLVRDINTRKPYALKIVKKSFVFSNDCLETLLREISNQLKLKHPRIVRLEDFFEDDDQIYLVLELAERGSLQSQLQKREKMPEKEACPIFLQALEALQYLHEIGILHCDLKPDNVLLDALGGCKLCDFGASRQKTGPKWSEEFRGGLDYIDPVVLKGDQYDEKSEYWALGILLIEMVTGQTPFAEYVQTNQKRQAILSYSYKPGETNSSVALSPELEDLLGQMLKSSPGDRIPPEKIPNHPWVLKHCSTCLLYTSPSPRDS